MDKKLERFFAILAHISYLFFGIGFILIPAAVYLWFCDKNDFIAEHSLEALKAQGILLLIGVVLFISSFFVVGIILLPFYAIIALIYVPLSLYASYKALRGETYRYPRI